MGADEKEVKENKEHEAAAAEMKVKEENTKAAEKKDKDEKAEAKKKA